LSTFLSLFGFGQMKNLLCVLVGAGGCGAEFMPEFVATFDRFGADRVPYWPASADPEFAFAAENAKPLQQHCGYPVLTMDGVYSRILAGDRVLFNVTIGDRAGSEARERLSKLMITMGAKPVSIFARHSFVQDDGSRRAEIGEGAYIAQFAT